jgi:hypothetical protein
MMQKVVRTEGEGLLLAKHEALMALARRYEFRSHRELIAAFEELAAREEPFPVDALSHELKVLYGPSIEGAIKQMGPYFFQFQNLPYNSFRQNFLDPIVEEIFRPSFMQKPSPKRSVLALLQDSER